MIPRRWFDALRGPGVALAALAAFVASSPVDLRAQEAPPAIPGLDAYIRDAMAQWHVPGLSLAVVRGDSVLALRGYGVRRLGEPGTVDGDTRFAIGSCSKAFTATALATLVSDGSLTWEDRVQDIVPWVQLRDPWITRELRVRDMVSNRVGLEHGYGFERHSRDRADYLAKLRHLDSRSGFRSTYAYSNEMFGLAEEVAATASGSTWENLLRGRLFTPLGMDATTSHIATFRSDLNRAAAHVMVRPDSLVPVEWQWADSVETGAGGFSASAADMARWLRFQLGDGSAGGRRVLDPEVLAETHRPQVTSSGGRMDPNLAEVVGEGPDGLRYWSYAMGWFVTDYRRNALVWHSGAITGFSCMMMLVPEQSIGVFVGTNTLTDYMHYGLALHIVDALLDLPARDWNRRFHEIYERRLGAYLARANSMAAERRPDVGPSLPPAELAGSYTSPVFGEARVEDRQGRLFLALWPDRWEMVHWQYDTFELRPVAPAVPPGLPALLRPPLATFVLDAAGSSGTLDLSAIELGAFTRVHP